MHDCPAADSVHPWAPIDSACVAVVVVIAVVVVVGVKTAADKQASMSHSR